MDRQENMATTEMPAEYNLTSKESGLSLSVKESPSTFDVYYEVGVHVFIYLAPVCGAIGLLGNVTSFIVMMSEGMRRMSTSIYLAALAVADTMSLLYVLVRYWYADALDNHFYLQNDILCKLDPIWKRFPVVLAAWLVISVCVERFIVTWFPLKASVVCRPRTAKIIIGLIAGLSLIYSIAVILQFGVRQGSCDLSGYKAYFYVKDTKWILTILYSFLPIGFLTLLTAFITLKLQRMRRKQREMTSSSTKTQQNAAAKATTMVLTVVVFYVICTFPATVLLTLYRELNTGGNARKETKFIVLITHVTILVNHGMNFFLYVLTSEKFRSKLAEIFCCKGQRDKQTVSMSTQLGTIKM